MRRAGLALLTVAALLAAAPARAGEGVYLTIDGGYLFWNRDALKTNLPKQVGAANTALLLDNQMPDGGLFALRLGYNIGGHVAFEGAFAIHPWDILAETRGGLGLMGLATRWFPLQGLVRPNRQVDFSVFSGINYVISGGNGVADTAGGTVANSGRGFDGMAFEFGGTFELYPARFVSLGITPRYTLMHPLRYFTDFNKRDQGGQIPLTGSVGGSMMSICLSVTFHFEPQPD